MYCTVGTCTILYIPWNAKHFYLYGENDHFFLYEYTDFYILINPFTAKAGYLQMCVRYIFARNVSSLHCDDITTKTMLLCGENDIYIFFNFQHNSSKSVNPVLPFRAWQISCDFAKSVSAKKMLRRKWIKVSELYKFTWSSVGRQTILFNRECFLNQPFCNYHVVCIDCSTINVLHVKVHIVKST